MSTTATTRPAGLDTAQADRPTPLSQDATPAEIIPVVAPAAPAAPAPVRRSILHAARADGAAAHRERLATSPFADWRDAAPTELLPAVPAGAGSTVSPLPSGQPSPARARVSTHRKPTAGRGAARTPSRRPSPGTKGLRHPARQGGSRTGLRRHLRAALTGLLIAAAVLTGLQLYAAAGISSARQAALEQARTHASPAATLSGQSTYTPTSPTSPMSGQSDPKPDWVTEHTGAAYDRTNPAASPLDLPRCTTSPDTPLPCLATISPSQTRAVVLEEDASLTALVRR